MTEEMGNGAARESRHRTNAFVSKVLEHDVSRHNWPTGYHVWFALGIHREGAITHAASAGSRMATNAALHRYHAR